MDSKGLHYHHYFYLSKKRRSTVFVRPPIDPPQPLLFIISRRHWPLRFALFWHTNIVPISWALSASLFHFYYQRALSLRELTA